MKSFALSAALAVIVSAQGETENGVFDPNSTMTDEQIADLFNNNEGGLISPAPAAEGEENGGGTTTSAIVDAVAKKEDVQGGIDWVKDLYNTLCSSMGDMDGSHDGMHHDDMHHDDMNHDDMHHDDGSTMPKTEDGSTMPTTEDAAMPKPEDATMPMPEEEEGGSYDALIRLQRLHGSFCDTIRSAHGDMDEWNNADAAGKQEIESKYSEEVLGFFEDFFDGAMGSFAVAGTALAASVAVLTF